MRLHSQERIIHSVLYTSLTRMMKAVSSQNFQKLLHHNKRKLDVLQKRKKNCEQKLFRSHIAAIWPLFNSNISIRPNLSTQKFITLYLTPQVSAVFFFHPPLNGNKTKSHRLNQWY